MGFLVNNYGRRKAACAYTSNRLKRKFLIVSGFTIFDM